MTQIGGADGTEQATVGLPIPASDPDLFRYAVTDDILRLLLDNPYDQFTIRELGRPTDNAAQSVTSWGAPTTRKGSTQTHTIAT
jgi:hypothetical protein